MDSKLYERLIKDFVNKDDTEEILFSKLDATLDSIRGEASEEILAGLSTVLWYITIIARNRGSSLGKIMINNYYDLERQESNRKAKLKLRWRDIT